MKQKLANYYKDLPQGFTENFRIDAKKTSVGVILNLIGFAIALIAAVVCYLAKFGLNFAFDFDYMTASALFALGVCLILYLIIHELTHGLAYKILTKQKLKFGLTLTVAYCGLKEGYVNKKTALISILAPCVIHSIWMIVAICLVPANIWAIALILLFALHFGGCVGDLWGACILIFKYAGKSVLMSDSGPCQIFCTYSAEAAETAPTEETEAMSSPEAAVGQTEEDTE